ncbi:MAG: hypothetical protein ACYC8T_19845 [Myxococcaceae bacterium]
MRIWPMCVLAVVASSCLHDNREQRDRGSMGIFDSAPEVKAPRVDRCAGHGKSAARANCDEARYLAQVYARKLSTGDEVCLEGGFGDSPTGACLARAAVADTKTNMVLLEVREARPDSRWFRKVQNQIWFEEGALVDLYLVEHGY